MAVWLCGSLAYLAVIYSVVGLLLLLCLVCVGSRSVGMPVFVHSALCALLSTALLVGAIKTYSVRHCENEDVVLGCPYNQRIRITHAFYGRRMGQTHMCQSGQVLRPLYNYVGCLTNSKEVLRVVRAK